MLVLLVGDDCGHVVELDAQGWARQLLHEHLWAGCVGGPVAAEPAAELEGVVMRLLPEGIWHFPGSAMCLLGPLGVPRLVQRVVEDNLVLRIEVHEIVVSWAGSTRLV